VDTNCDQTEACTGHNCCVSHDGAGCNDSSIQECVCASQMFSGCCGAGGAWSQACTIAVSLLNCGACAGETSCDNDEDDDEDGATDCDDSDCYGNDPACTHNCCETRDGGGCNSEAIQECVCGLAPVPIVFPTPSDCCTDSWSDVCVIAATLGCGAGCN
jgi:hypothetical protein